MSSDSHTNDTDPRGSETTLVVSGLSKCYHIYDTPRDRLLQAVARKWRTYYRPFWALRDVNFELCKGEALGIVGENGSGKSTLLQIIAGTLSPTHGEVRIRGRLAALLELGSGFNTEFTGRENVYLNGAILGFSKTDIDAKFDDIASFADIGDFLDQPVKTYSSGMRARLAFSVAVSVEPEVLILDEILSVGDMGFQQKCIARMRRLLDTGVTLLYVSHSPDSVKSICQKGLFLEHGEQVYFGSSEESVNRFVASVRSKINDDATKKNKAPRAAGPPEKKFENVAPGTLRYGTGEARISEVRLRDSEDRPTNVFEFGEPIVFEAVIESDADIERPDVAFIVRDASGVDLLGTSAADERKRLPKIEANKPLVVRFRFSNPLRGGNYGVSVALTALPEEVGEFGITIDNIDGCMAFRVLSDNTRPVHHKVHVPVEVETETPDQQTDEGEQEPSEEQVRAAE